MTDRFLMLTAAQAQALHGPTSAQAALSPMPLADGLGFVLPLAVREDPAHQSRRAELALLPEVEVSHEAFPPAPRPVAGA